MVGRIGGDEFFVLMQNIGTLKNVRKKAELLQLGLRQLCDPYDLEMLSVSIGVGIYPKDAGKLSELYARVDAALYEAKRTGKDRVVFAADKQKQ